MAYRDAASQALRRPNTPYAARQRLPRYRVPRGYAAPPAVTGAPAPGPSASLLDSLRGPAPDLPGAAAGYAARLSPIPRRRFGTQTNAAQLQAALQSLLGGIYG